MARGWLYLIAIWMLALASPAWAQDETRPRIAAAAAVTLLKPDNVNLPPACTTLGLPCTSPKTVPDAGLALSVSGRVTAHVALVGELSSWANIWYADGTQPGRRTNHVRAALAGLRAQTNVRPSHGRSQIDVVFFGQLLAGPQVSSVTPSRHAIQPGGGVDVRINEKITARCEVDYIKVPAGERDLSTSRVMIGAVFPR